MKTTKQATCQKCQGLGTIAGFTHVKGGVCFTCAGSGKANVRRIRKTAPVVAKVLPEGKGVDAVAMQVIRSNIDRPASFKLLCSLYPDTTLAQRDELRAGWIAAGNAEAVFDCLHYDIRDAVLARKGAA